MKRGEKLMAKKYRNYQYETSPRKLQPEYIPQKRKKAKQIKTNEKQIEQKQNKKEKISKSKTIITIAIAFGALLVISYRNSQITEQFTEVKNLKSELSTIEKENEQLKVNIESNINLSKIEKEAEEQLGMKKIDNDQKVYVSLPKKDYVEPATENVKTEDNSNWFANFVNMLLGK